ncbi:hypothetical protein CPC08DRAFT_771092 [Agrocybe pediades]|nr:hypothetical protein CPC08DRAFT_771092 [Agrocybe pediades]
MAWHMAHATSRLQTLRLQSILASSGLLKPLLTFQTTPPLKIAAAYDGQATRPARGMNNLTLVEQDDMLTLNGTRAGWIVDYERHGDWSM